MCDYLHGGTITIWEYNMGEDGSSGECHHDRVFLQDAVFLVVVE